MIPPLYYIIKLVWDKSDTYHIKCTHCNHKNPVKAQICHSCGAPLESRVPPMPLNKAFISRPLTTDLINIKSSMTTRDFVCSLIFLFIILLASSGLLLLNLGGENSRSLSPIHIIFGGAILLALTGMVTASIRWNNGRKEGSAKDFEVRYNAVRDTFMILLFIIFAVIGIISYMAFFNS